MISSLRGGGAELNVLRLSRALRQAGHESHVISLDCVVDYDISQEPNVHTLPGQGKNIVGFRTYDRQARQLRGLIDRLESVDGRAFDLIVANLFVASIVVSRCGFENQVHVVQNSIDGLLRLARSRSPVHFLRELSRWRAIRGRNLIAISRGLQRELESSPRIRPRSVRTIYSALDGDAIRRLAAAPTAGLPTGEYLIHIGRAARQKRHDVLLKAFEEVPRRYRLVLLASDTSRLKSMVKDRNLADRVVFPGFQQNPFPWIAGAKLLVLSSDFEGLSNACAEALACGTSVVSTDAPHGPSEVLSGELQKWLVPPGDPAALAAKINEALSSEIDVSGAEILDLMRPETAARKFARLASDLQEASVGLPA